MRLNYIPGIVGNGGSRPGYAYLYNWYALHDVGGLASEGWHVITYDEIIALHDYVNDPVHDGIKLKEAGDVYWETDNGLDLYGFKARGGGFRNDTEGAYYSLRESLFLWTDVENQSYSGFGLLLYDVDQAMGWHACNKKAGCSVRLIKDSTDKEDGEMGTYVGNDGKVYGTVCIDGKEWMSENLMETKFADNTDIPHVVDATEWAALVDSGWCDYGEVEEEDLSEYLFYRDGGTDYQITVLIDEVENYITV